MTFHFGGRQLEAINRQVKKRRCHPIDDRRPARIINAATRGVRANSHDAIAQPDRQALIITVSTFQTHAIHSPYLPFEVVGFLTNHKFFSLGQPTKAFLVSILCAAIPTVSGPNREGMPFYLSFIVPSICPIERLWAGPNDK